MDFSYREDEQAVAELARQILEDQATNERMKELEASGTPYDETLWRTLAGSNLLGTAIPEEHGGSDLGFMALCLLLQEVGRAVARVPAFPALALGALPVAKFGTAAQQDAWLPGVASGETFLSAALQEVGPAEPAHPSTTAITARKVWHSSRWVPGWSLGASGASCSDHISSATPPARSRSDPTHRSQSRMNTSRENRASDGCTP